MKGKIICGFAGIGKSYCAKNNIGVVDLESTPFEKDFDRYIKVAKHMADNGYIVLLSCHSDLRDKLHEQNIEYDIVLPHHTLQREYLKRYINRGNTPDFVRMMSENWDVFCQAKRWELPHYLDEEQYLNLLNHD